MNKFLEEKEKLLNSIENNTAEHWKEYYKDVPLDCIFDDLVLDVNEIKRLTEENQKLKEQLQQRDNIINKVREFIKIHQRKDEFLDLNEWQTRDLLEILDNKGE